MDQRQVKAAVDQCLRILREYHVARRDLLAPEYAKVQGRYIAACLHEQGVTPGSAHELVLLPVEAVALTRYGPEVGPRLFAPLLRGFEDLYAMAAAGGLPEP